MSTWVLCGIGSHADPGRWGGGGGIASGPPSSPRRRDNGAAIASSRTARSTSPVAARMSPSGPTCASWNETMSARRIRRIGASPPFGSRPYGWSFGNTRRASSRNARARVSSASMRTSFSNSPRTRSISFGGNDGPDRHSTRMRTVSAAVSRVHRPWNERSSSPLWNSSVAPIPSRRSASFAALLRRVPLNRSRDVNSATPTSEPSAATPARALRLRRRGPLELLDLSVEHRLDTIEGGAAGEGHARDQQRRVELHLLPHADVRREPRVDERPIQAVRMGLPVARGEGHRPAPAAEDRRQEDERRDIVVARRRDVPSGRQEVGRARALEVAPPLAVPLPFREAERVRRRLRLQGPERLADVLHRDGGVEAADEDQGRVVRRVESQVVTVQRVPVQRGEVLLVPDR